jgi:hypothetical protein
LQVEANLMQILSMQSRRARMRQYEGVALFTLH